MGREDNVKVFEHTRFVCSQNSSLAERINKSIKGQRVYLEKDVLSEPDLNIYEKKATVRISKKRSFEAAKAYKGEKTAVHNFASASNPGGGVINGANAQEECLCRCSGLYFMLSVPEMMKNFYLPHRKAKDPVHNDDIIYSPSVTVFKTDTASPQMMSEKEWYEVDVITCAAPNLRNKPSNSYNSGDGKNAINIKDDELLCIHEKRLRRILTIAINEGAETIVLGAFGCGAFLNNPEIVARAARNVIPEYLHAFKNIEFAVYCSSKDDRNYRVFERVLKSFSKQ